MAKRQRAHRRGGDQEPGWQIPVVFLVVVLVVAFVILSGPAAWRDRLWVALGPAVVLAIPALAGVLWVAWREPGLFLRRWNRWLAGIVFAGDGMLFLSLFHPPNRSYTPTGLAGDLGHSLREFLGSGSLAEVSVSGLRVEFPQWGSFWGLILLALAGALVFSPRATSRGLGQVAHRLGRAFASLTQRFRRPLPEAAPPPPETQEAAAPTAPTTPPAPPARLRLPAILRAWQHPSLELLETPPKFSFDQAEAQRVAGRLEQALASYGIEAKIVEVNPGPTVTQFGLEPGWVRHFREVKETDAAGQTITRQEEASRTRVKVGTIAARDKDLAVVLAAPALRIEAPVPGKSFVGVEVPNAKPASVALRSVMGTPAYSQVRDRSGLALALGLGVGGQAGVADLSRLPHLLMGGTTGSGKSVCLKAFLTCLALTATPEQVRLVLIDPKRVEFVRWRALPHLLYPPVVEASQAAPVLQELIGEMEQRYRRLAEFEVSDVEGYNRKAPGPLPYIVVLVDELADLMMAAPQEVERGLTRLAQLGRSAGIHLIVATQRPSVDVVTGLIKANFPARISFAVASQVDSRVILDMPGAEHLLGRGDMLFLPPDAPQPRRYQGCFVSEAEMDRVVGWWVSQLTAPAGPPLPGKAAPGEKKGPEADLG